MPEEIKRKEDIIINEDKDQKEENLTIITPNNFIEDDKILDNKEPKS